MFFVGKQTGSNPGFMLSVERAKQLLNDAALTDKEVEEIRDGFRALAEVIFEQWQVERTESKKPTAVPLQ